LREVLNELVLLDLNLVLDFGCRQRAYPGSGVLAAAESVQPRPLFVHTFVFTGS
jgi:hypothetical protein